MINLSRKMRLIGLALAVALLAQPVLGLGTATHSSAGVEVVLPVAVASGGGGHVAGFLVAGVFVSVASIMACAAIIAGETGEQMTPEEALMSMFIPLGCLLAGHNEE